MDDVPAIYLDGSGWRDVPDFCEALYDLVGGPRSAACSVQAVVDSIVWADVRLREPPYRVIVRSLSDPALRDFIALCGRSIAEGRQDYQQINGEDVKVALTLGD